eukprot:6108117-Lingulodinium_polyedra.AAC.1
MAGASSMPTSSSTSWPHLSLALTFTLAKVSLAGWGATSAGCRKMPLVATGSLAANSLISSSSSGFSSAALSCCKHGHHHSLCARPSEAEPQRGHATSTS